MKKWRTLHRFLTACTLGLFVQGCVRGHYRSAATGVTPGLTAEDRKHARDATNPNGPFVLVSREKNAGASRPSPVQTTAIACNSDDLAVVEVSEQVNGSERYVSLAFVNEGEDVCKLGGYPTLSLLDEHGGPIGSVSVVRVNDTSQITPSTNPQEVTPGLVELMLAPRGEAYFGISWVSGDQCPAVAGLAVRAPGMMRTFSINHPLSVCSGQIRVTTLRSTQQPG